MKTGRDGIYYKVYALCLWVGVSISGARGVSIFLDSLGFFVLKRREKWRMAINLYLLHKTHV